MLVQHLRHWPTLNLHCVYSVNTYVSLRNQMSYNNACIVHIIKRFLLLNYKTLVCYASFMSAYLYIFFPFCIGQIYIE